MAKYDRSLTWTHTGNLSTGRGSFKANLFNFGERFEAEVHSIISGRLAGRHIVRSNDGRPEADYNDRDLAFQMAEARYQSWLKLKLGQNDDIDYDSDPSL